MRNFLLLLALAGGAVTECQAQDALLADGSVQRGATLYAARCGGCHSVHANRVGPRHFGVVGRVAGSVPDFDGYSAALKASGITWTPEKINQWLTSPEALVPGQRMGYQLSQAQDRADVIAYLATLK